jgi:hypothetical protein
VTARNQGVLCHPIEALDNGSSRSGFVRPISGSRSASGIWKSHRRPRWSRPSPFAP